MASENTYDWIENHKKYIKGRVLETGSHRYKDHAFMDLRGLTSEQPKATTYLGTDIMAGDNVDIAVDLTDPFDVIFSRFDTRKFNTIFCISVLEHIPDVFSACKNISELLSPKGALFLSVPFVFRVHGYPSDFWRFTPQAIKFLFPEVDFRDGRYSIASTLEDGDTMSLSRQRADKLNRFIYRPKSKAEKMERKFAKAEANNNEIVPYSLAPSMINMLGFKI